MLLQADAAIIPLADKSVHCVVTSPPYWGLRKYSGEQGRIWGGDSDCAHEWIERRYYTMRGASSETSEAFSEAGEANSERLKNARWRNDSVCQLCGAWFGSLGLEPTPGQHIMNMVEIFREVRRVLRDDGVVWLNYGDSYSGSGGPGSQYDNKATIFESGSGKAGSQVGDIIGKHRDVETLHSGDGHDVRLGPTPANRVLAHRPTCECGHEEHVPGIVLDPFGGSGTTGMVARELQRRWVVMDISMPYLDEQAKLRTKSGSPKNVLDGLPMFEDKL